MTNSLSALHLSLIELVYCSLKHYINWGDKVLQLRKQAGEKSGETLPMKKNGSIH